MQEDLLDLQFEPLVLFFFPSLIVINKVRNATGRTDNPEG